MSIVSASATISSVILVTSDTLWGICFSGLTKHENSSITSPSFNFIALFIKSFADVIASIWLIWVCICSSTLFTSLLSCLVTFFNPSASTIVFAITVNSFENVSIWAVPDIFNPGAFCILFIVFLAVSLFKNALHVIVLVPSYKSKLNKVFPDFKVLSSV